MTEYSSGLSRKVHKGRTEPNVLTVFVEYAATMRMRVQPIRVLRIYRCPGAV